MVPFPGNFGIPGHRGWEQTEEPDYSIADLAFFKKIHSKILNIAAEPQNLESESSKQTFSSIQLKPNQTKPNPHRLRFKSQLHLFLVAGPWASDLTLRIPFSSLTCKTRTM